MNRYFAPNASFVHPFCRVPSFEKYHIPGLGEVNSRMLFLAILKWYKILSPKIDIEVESSGMCTSPQPPPHSSHRPCLLTFLIIKSSISEQVSST